MEAVSTTTGSSRLPLEDRVAIVTGASRGIGRGIALHLASLGAKLVVCYASNSAQAELVAAEINSSSDVSTLRAITCEVDVSNPDQVKSMFDKAEDAFKSPAHILVNSAGVLSPKLTIANLTIENFDHVFSVNTRGAFLCCKEAANRLVKGGGGRIIMITTSGVASLRVCYGSYAASKAAVEAMVKVLAKELKGTGITANSVAPGPVATDMVAEFCKNEEMMKKLIEENPMSRIGQPSDVTPLVGFLASDAGEWVNGQAIRINGGYI